MNGMSKILELSASSFHDGVIHAGNPVVVEFYIHSCPHCMKFAPVYSRLADELDGEACFARFDVHGNEENHTFAHNRGIYTVPTLEVYYHGRVIGNMIGEHEFEQTLSAVKGFLSKKDENVGPGTALPHPGAAGEESSRH